MLNPICCVMMQAFGDRKWDGSVLQPAPGGEVLGEHVDRWRPPQ